MFLLFLKTVRDFNFLLNRKSLMEMVSIVLKGRVHSKRKKKIFGGVIWAVEMSTFTPL